MATSADGAFAVSGSDDGTVRVWDVASGAQRTFADAGVAVNSVGFSPDNGLVLAVLANGHVAVYDAGTGEAAVRLSAPPELRPTPSVSSRTAPKYGDSPNSWSSSDRH